LTVNCTCGALRRRLRGAKRHEQKQRRCKERRQPAQ